MSKQTVAWLIVATSLIVLGIMVFVLVMTVNHWDFTQLNTAQYETNTHQISENFRDISIESDTADIVFLPATDGECRVVCHESKHEKHLVSVQENALSITITDEREWYNYIGITWGSPKITVYLPSTEYNELSIKESTGDIQIPKEFQFTSMDLQLSTGDVQNEASTVESMNIQTTTGDIRVANVSVGSLELSVSTGDVMVTSAVCKGDIDVRVSTGKATLSDVSCKNMTSSGSTGDVFLENVISDEVCSIKRTTGDVKLERCDAAEIAVQTSTGDIKGTLLSEKVFVANSNTGKVTVPETLTGGRCKLTADTGNINISIAN